MPKTRPYVVRFVTGLFSNWRAASALLAAVVAPILQPVILRRTGVTLPIWWVSLVALVVAAYLEWRDLAAQIEPQVEISLPSDGDAPGFHQSWGSWEQVQVGWDQETEEPVYESDGSWEIYRVRVKNLGAVKTIRNVRLQLKAITPDVWGPAGEISSFPLPLHPEHVNEKTYLFDLAPSEERFVDVIRFSGGPAVKVCAVSQSLVNLYADKRPTLELQAIGDDVPASQIRLLRFWIDANRLRVADSTPAATTSRTTTLSLTR